MEPTEEQKAFIFSLTRREPTFLSARAGTGKTTTIRLGVEALLSSGVPPQEISAVAFNKANQEDLSRALPLSVKVSTLHSLGFAALRRFLPKRLQIEDDKVYRLLTRAGIRGKNARDTFKDTLRLISVAKNWALLPAPDTQPNSSGTGRGPWKTGLTPDTAESWTSLVEHFEIWDADIIKAREVLLASNRAALEEGLIDFDDMVYLPLVLGARILAADFLIVDEAQDLSPLNLALLKNTPSKIWYVGDPFQAIYGWRGAASGLVERLGLPVLPLTNCWRCSGEIISEARKYVPDIQTTNPSGLPVQRLKVLPDFASLAPATILARTNSTLISIALKLRASRKRVCIFGRDFVKTLEGILGKLKGINSKTLLESLRAWAEKMSDKYPHQAHLIRDYFKCLKTILQEVSGAQAASQLLKEIFSDSPQPGDWVLSTIHKAKGKEFQKVFLIDWTPKGEQGWMKEEERNLKYVGVTRAREELIIIPEDPLSQDSLEERAFAQTHFTFSRDEDIYSEEGELLSSPTREDGLWD